MLSQNKIATHFKGKYLVRNSLKINNPRRESICHLQIMNCHYMQLQLLITGEEEQYNVPSVQL